MKFIEAVLILSGMIIGVGMFGIPFSFVASGFWLGALELIILTGVILLLHLFYGEIVLKTSEYHRMPGYVRVYLGRWPAMLSWGSALFGILGTLLAYILVGSIFLDGIFQNFWPGSSEIFWALFMAGAGAVIIFFPLRKAATVNGVLTALLIVFILFLIIALFPKVSFANLGGANFREVFTPYGVLLFALSGGVVIPDLISFLGKDRARARAAITLGTIIPALLYFFFALTIAGVLGNQVSEEAIRGLLPVMGKNVVIFGNIIGFLAVFTSFVVLLSSFRALLHLDLGMPKFISWAAASFSPPALYFLGFHSFIAVIGVVGAIAVGIDSLLIIASYHALRARAGVSFVWFSYFWKALIYALIIAGVVFEIYKIVF